MAIDTTWIPLQHYTRPDGATVTLERDGVYRRVTVTRGEEHLVRPMEYTGEATQAAASAFRSRCIEPLRLSADVDRSLNSALDEVKVTRKEREDLARARSTGRPSTLAALLQTLASRQPNPSVTTWLRALAEQVRADEKAALAALPVEVR